MPINGLMAFGSVNQLVHWVSNAIELMPDATYSRARRILGYHNATLLVRPISKYVDAMMLAGMEFTPGYVHMGVGIPDAAKQFIRARTR